MRSSTALDFWRRFEALPPEYRLKLNFKVSDPKHLKVAFESFSGAA